MTHRPQARSLVALLTVIGAFWVVGPPRASAATAKQVDAALERAKTYLYSVQKDGTWETVPAPGPVTDAITGQDVKAGQWGGPTALATYALLAAGENPQGAKLKPAIDFLKKHESVGVYALGLRCQVWLQLPQTPDVQAAMKRDAGALLKSVKGDGSARGMFDYTPLGRTYSHSRAQYGVLGLWAADQTGVPIPEAFWPTVEKAWIDHQDASGGWTYKAPKETDIAVTPGMTAVGVATLFITQDYVHAGEGVACKGNLSNPAIDKGMKWMADHFDLVATDKQYARDFPYPTLYAVERIGVAGGTKYFGGVDWYEKGSNWLLGKQGKTGGWAGGGTPQVAGLGDTCFAVLFLARGRAPIAFNKLDYSRGALGPTSPPWNQRPRDVANALRWVGKNIERDLNWQVVPTAAPVNDLLDAPVLYISGNKPLDLNAEEKAKLREYVERGGLILGHADCGTAAFATSFQKLGTELFPKYEFRELPENHPLYDGPFPRRKWKMKFSVRGLGNEAREFMLLVPVADPARFWQVRSVAGKEEFFQFAAAVFLYTQSNRDLRYRGDTYWVEADPKVMPTRSLKVARLEYPGNWDPEPGGWRRLAAIVRNEHRLALTVDPIKLGDGKLAALNAPKAPAVAHLTGTAKFTLTEPQRADIRQFVEAGGTLVVDAAGGAGPFADSVEAELTTLFPASRPEILPPDHPIYAPGGEPIDAIRYRKRAQQVMTGSTRTPRLRAIVLNGRPAVVYSREDLTAGLVGQPTDGILGYEPETATELMGAALLFVAPKEPKPATQPTTRATTRPAATTKPAARPAKPKTVPA